MALNPFFTQGTTGEQNLQESLVIEQIKMFGKNVYYVPRTLVKEDTVFTEDTLSEFNDAFEIEAYIEDASGFRGDGDMFSKFGVRISDQCTFVISRKRFTEAVDDNTTLIVEGRPNEGDIVYVPLLKGFFEIQFVEDQEPFYQLGNLPVYKLKVTRWEYASEEINTGINTLDAVEDKYSLNEYAYRFQLEYGQEVLTGRGSIALEDYHDYSTGQPAFLMNEDYTAAEVVQTQSPYASNLDLNTEAGYGTVGDLSDDILDFTERNPFGEIDE